MKCAGDHKIELAYKEVQRILSPYYEIDYGEGRSAERRTTQSRLRYRHTHPEVDGALWAMGYTKGVRSIRAIPFALGHFESIYGFRPTRRAVVITRD